MTTYDLTIEVVIRKSYMVEADNIGEAQDKALESAIEEYPGADVWLEGRKPGGSV